MAERETEARLVLRLRQGRPGALEELYRLHRAAVWRFLARLVGGSRVGLAEDLFQDTWVSVARNARRLREDTQLLPWLLTIARNKQRNSLRVFHQQALQRRHLGRPEPAPSPEVEAQGRAEARAVELAFRRLAEAHREILLLSAVEGLDAPAIGAILDLRPDAVRKRLSRARAELKALLERGEHER